MNGTGKISRAYCILALWTQFSLLRGRFPSPFCVQIFGFEIITRVYCILAFWTQSPLLRGRFPSPFCVQIFGFEIMTQVYCIPALWTQSPNGNFEMAIPECGDEGCGAGRMQLWKDTPAPQFPEINFTLGNFLIALLSRSDCPSFPKLFPFTSCSFL